MAILKIMLNLPCALEMEQQRLTDSMFVYNMFTEYSKPIVETYCSKKKFLSKYYCSLTMQLGIQQL